MNDVNKNQMQQKKTAAGDSRWTHPATGTTLVVLSGLSFLFLCMILPLVGPAAMYGSGSPGADTVMHKTENMISFGSVLILSLILATSALYSKVQRRKVDDSPYPYSSLGFVCLLVLITIAFVTGLLSI